MTTSTQLAKCTAAAHFKRYLQTFIVHRRGWLVSFRLCVHPRGATRLPIPLPLEEMAEVGNSVVGKKGIYVSIEAEIPLAGVWISVTSD
jgi:hypothetical protein